MSPWPNPAHPGQFSNSSSFPLETDLHCRNASQQLHGWEKCTCFYVLNLIASFSLRPVRVCLFLLLSFSVPNLFLICFPCRTSTTPYFPRLFLVAPFYPEGNSSHLGAQGFFSFFSWERITHFNNSFSHHVISPRGSEKNKMSP